MSNGTQTVRINANLTWAFRRTARGWLAECPPLGLVLEADDEAEARSLVEEGLHFFFLDHFEEGTLAAFLQSKGWTLSSPLPARPAPGEVVKFDVPWNVEQHAS